MPENNKPSDQSKEQKPKIGEFERSQSEGNLQFTRNRSLTFSTPSSLGTTNSIAANVVNADPTEAIANVKINGFNAALKNLDLTTIKDLGSLQQCIMTCLKWAISCDINLTKDTINALANNTFLSSTMPNSGENQSGYLDILRDAVLIQLNKVKDKDDKNMQAALNKIGKSDAKKALELTFNLCQGLAKIRREAAKHAVDEVTQKIQEDLAKIQTEKSSEPATPSETDIPKAELPDENNNQTNVPNAVVAAQERLKQAFTGKYKEEFLNVYKIAFINELNLLTTDDVFNSAFSKTPNLSKTKDVYRRVFSLLPPQEKSTESYQKTTTHFQTASTSTLDMRRFSLTSSKSLPHFQPAPFAAELHNLNEKLKEAVGAYIMSTVGIIGIKKIDPVSKFRSTIVADPATIKELKDRIDKAKKVLKDSSVKDTRGSLEEFNNTIQILKDEIKNLEKKSKASPAPAPYSPKTP